MPTVASYDCYRAPPVRQCRGGPVNEVAKPRPVLPRGNTPLDRWLTRRSVLNDKAALASIARKVTVRLRSSGTVGKGTPDLPFWGKIRRRCRFLRWALMVQVLKGAAFAGGGILVQAVLARYFGS